MRSWLALLLSPSIALGTQSVMYALVTPSCASQSHVALHVSAAVALFVVLVLGAWALADWSRLRAEALTADSDAGDARVTRRFLAVVATAVSALSALVILGMWFGSWVLSPCAPWP